jgi:hypothetical protein
MQYYLYRQCNLTGLNIPLPNIDFLGNIRQQSIWLTSECYYFIKRKFYEIC